MLHLHPDLAIETDGLVKVFGETTRRRRHRPRRAGRHGLRRARARTAPARPRPSACSPPCSGPTAGSARVLGHDVVADADAVRGCVSLTGQFASVDEELNGRENLVLVGRLLGLPRRPAEERAGELLDAFGLTEAADRLVRTYSGGMRRRLDIAASIVVTPELLFLDEPTTGLDPRSRNQVWDIVRVLVAAGTTVLLTTQHLDEADQLADRIAIIDHGRVIAEGTPGELKALVGSGTLHVRLAEPEVTAAGQEVALRRPRRADLSSRPTRPRCRPELRPPPMSPPPWPIWPGPASPSTSWPSASPASTRCSSPSPGTRQERKPHDHDRNRSRDRDHGRHRHRARARRGPTARGADPPHPPGPTDPAGRLAGLRLAGDAQDQARADAAVRRHRLPDHVRAALHVPVRRRPRRIAPGVPPGAAARHPRHDRGVDHHVHRPGAQHRHLEGRSSTGSGRCRSGDRRCWSGCCWPTPCAT